MIGGSIIYYFPERRPVDGHPSLVLDCDGKRPAKERCPAYSPALLKTRNCHLSNSNPNQVTPPVIPSPHRQPTKSHPSKAKKPRIDPRDTYRLGIHSLTHQIGPFLPVAKGITLQRKTQNMDPRDALFFGGVQEKAGCSTPQRIKPQGLSSASRRETPL